MKAKYFKWSALMALLLGLSGCNIFFPTGSDGKVYLKLTKDSSVYLKSNYDNSYSYWPIRASYLSFTELPATIAYGTSYQISSGSGTYWGHYTMRAYDGHYYYFYDYSSSSSSTYGDLCYSSGEPGSLYSFDFTYDVEAKKGSSGFLSGKNGEDVYYELYLAFNPYYYSLSKSSSATGKSVALPSTTSVDSSGKITKVFTDTNYTITVVASPSSDKLGTPLSDVTPADK